MAVFSKHSYCALSWEGPQSSLAGQWSLNILSWASDGCVSVVTEDEISLVSELNNPSQGCPPLRAQKSAFSLCLPKRLTAKSLLFTKSLTDGVSSWLTCILCVLCIVCILTITSGRHYVFIVQYCIYENRACKWTHQLKPMLSGVSWTNFTSNWAQLSFVSRWRPMRSQCPLGLETQYFFTLIRWHFAYMIWDKLLFLLGV